MSRAHGQIRRGQVITTYGPGALIDLPRYAAIVGGLETWPRPGKLEEIDERRLARKLQVLSGLVAPPKLYAPPASEGGFDDAGPGIGGWQFPEWVLVQEESGSSGGTQRVRRLVHRRRLDRGRFERRPVVPIRFVRACPRGHVDDIDWHDFAHRGADCARIGGLSLVENGTSGDLIDLSVRCECGASRGLFEAKQMELNPLRTCSGARPWLGPKAGEPCSELSRLLIRTASNAWFPQVVSVLSLPDRGKAVDTAVGELWQFLDIVDDAAGLAMMKKKPQVADGLAQFSDEEVLAAIESRKSGGMDDRPVKVVELDALVAAPEGFGDDVPVDPNFHARRLPERLWRRSGEWGAVEAVVQVHRLREVLALVGFTRFDAEVPDIHGEWENGDKRAAIALEPSWYPAVENRGEGVLVLLRAGAVRSWLTKDTVKARIDSLRAGHDRWAAERKSKRKFPGGPYVLLHTLSHLLIQSLAARCGYAASSIRERVYADEGGDRYGILLYTGSPDSEGTLGGLVQQARHIERHLSQAVRGAALCSNDPVCSLHRPGESLEGRYQHGAACHGCALVAEPSCEMRNDFLDRALVAPVLGTTDAGFFGRRV